MPGQIAGLAYTSGGCDEGQLPWLLGAEIRQYVCNPVEAGEQVEQGWGGPQPASSLWTRSAAVEAQYLRISRAR